MERRDFLKATAAVAAGGAAYRPTSDAPGFPPPPTMDKGGMKYRVLGRTGLSVSIVGLGGFHLAKSGGASEDEAIRIVRRAVDSGINFCDNCWDYNGGESEKRLGKALRDGYRNRVVLMTKVDGRTAEAATGQVEQSLKRLQTDHLDLIQFHEVIRMTDPERIFAKRGALEAVLKLRDQGKVRHIGFTGHKSPAIHKHMFDVAAAHGFTFDTVQMPLNIMDAHFDSFQKTIFPIAQQAGTAVLAMKTFGDAFIYQTHAADPISMLHYSMSQPVAVVITGIDSQKILDQALAAAHSYTPMSLADQNVLLAKSLPFAGDGITERYKTTRHFDGTINNPEWLEKA